MHTVVFRDHKLNKCDQCGTRKQLTATFATNGRMYFLCRIDYFLLVKLVEGAARVGGTPAMNNRGY